MNPRDKSSTLFNTAHPEQSVPKLHRDASSKGER